MVRQSICALLVGCLLAGVLALTGPGSAGALQAATSTLGSGTNPDGTSGPPQNTVAPTVSRHGTVGVGTRLSCTQGTWANDPTAFRERWRRTRRLVHTGPTYWTVAADVGHTISCYVAATNPQGTSIVLAGRVTVTR